MIFGKSEEVQSRRSAGYILRRSGPNLMSLMYFSNDGSRLVRIFFACNEHAERILASSPFIPERADGVIWDWMEGEKHDDLTKTTPFEAQTSPKNAAI